MSAIRRSPHGKRRLAQSLGSIERSTAQTDFSAAISHPESTTRFTRIRIPRTSCAHSALLPLLVSPALNAISSRDAI